MIIFSQLRKSSTFQDIILNFKPHPSELNRISKLFSNAVMALVKPTQGEYLSTFGECSSYRSLLEIQQKMLSDPIGRQILKEKPRMRSAYVDFDALSRLPENTFGKHYSNYMMKNAFHPDERPIVKHIGDLDLAYIYQRYKEIHDFLHVLLSRGPSVYEEIEVKWFEFQQLELASAALASIVGPLRLTWSGKVDILTKAGPEMIMRANNARFCMNIYYEKYFEKDIKEVQEWFLDKNKLIS